MKKNGALVEWIEKACHSLDKPSMKPVLDMTGWVIDLEQHSYLTMQSTLKALLDSFWETQKIVSAESLVWSINIFSRR